MMEKNNIKTDTRSEMIDSVNNNFKFAGSWNFSTTSYCLENNNNLLNANWLTGFADGESSFMIIIRENPKSKIGWRVEARFSISLHKKDLALLQLIKNYFNGIGNINKEREDSIQYQVTTLQDLTNVIIPHFNKFPLITQKQADFKLLKMAIEIMNCKEHLTWEGLCKVVAIKASMNWGLSDNLKANLPDIVPIQRPLVQDQQIYDPNWLAGFASGECSFIVSILKSTTKLGETPVLFFKLTQHSKDDQLMESFIEYFGAGNTYKYREVVDFKIAKFKDLTDKVIPFFKKYPIVGVKALDFSDFCKVAELMKNKAHLTSEGLEEIQKIRLGMNKRRK